MSKNLSEIKAALSFYNQAMKEAGMTKEIGIQIIKDQFALRPWALNRFLQAIGAY